MFQKAQRKRAKLRLGLCSPSGGGKTYSSLLIARGLSPNGRIAMIDTENGSGDLYSDLFDYYTEVLSPPFTPERYIQLIQGAEREGYDVLIIDSLSHAWSGTGGVLDMHDMAVPAAKGNTWAAWREVTPQHNKLVDAMLQANMHVIATMRTKTAYEVVDENGKKKPIKVGLAPVQREGMDFEFTVVLELSNDKHIASVSKDRTGQLDGKHFIPTVETGQMLVQWLDSGYDAESASHQHLNQLSEAAKAITSNDTLTQFWRDCAATRQLLTTADLNMLTSIFREQKAKILAAKGTGSENQASCDHPQAGIETPDSGPEGLQNPSPGATAGAPSASVGAAPSQEGDPPTEEAVQEILALAAGAGITQTRLAALTYTATNGVTDDLRSVSNRVLSVVRSHIDKVAAKKSQSGPATIEGDIIPDGYVIQPEELALFYNNAVEDV